ncbi:MAG: ABC transporter permease subunit [Acidimicrobiia bacterium]
MRLLVIEWRRMWARRLPRMLLALPAVAIVIAGLVTFVTHSPEPPDESQIAQQIDEMVQECRRSSIREWENWADGNSDIDDPGYNEYLALFESGEEMADDQCNPEAFGVWIEDGRFCLVSLYEPNFGYRQGCPDLESVEVYEYVPGWTTINGVEYRTLAPIPSGLVPQIGLFMFALAAILGASFIGAEYKSGTVETVLLWEPRRGRVLGSKLAVAAVSAAAIHVLLLTLLVAVMVPSGLWRGSTAGVDGDFWLGVVKVILLGGVAAAVVATFSLSVSVLTRNTVGGVAAALGYFAASPILSLALFKGLRPFDLSENLTALGTGGEVGRFVSAGDWYDSVYSHGTAMAAVAVGVYLVLAVGTAVAVFARRDID